MNGDELDALLERYRVAHSRIAANLVDLDNHRAYEILSNGDVGPATVGRVGAALEAAPLLWRWLTQLGDIVDRAGELRQQGRPRGERAQQLRELLAGPSVVLSTDDVPLGERGMLDPKTTTRSITVEQLLERMGAVYGPLRDAVAEIDSIWSGVLPRLDAARRSLASMGQHLQEAGVGEPAEMAAARLALDELDRIVLTDPLAVGPNAGHDLDAAVEDAADRVDALMAEAASLSVELAGIDKRLASLRLLRAQAAAAYSEARAKIAAPGELIKPPGPQIIDGAGGLAEQAASIATMGPAALAEFRRWNRTAQAVADQLERALSANRAGLDRRDELRGRLAAYRAKARAMGIASVTHPDLADLADSAHNELFTAPVDVARASTLVERYGDGLRKASDGGSE